jgi:predicted permease
MKRLVFKLPRRSAKQIDDAVDAELQLHLDLRTAELVAEGMPAADARNAALREFGDVQYTRRYCREQDLGAERSARLRDYIEELAGNASFAVRSFRRRPGFAAVFLVTLALAIGANTAIFSVANAVLFAPLPYGNAGRLVALFERHERSHQERADMSAADLMDYREMQRSVTAIGILSVGGVTLRDGAQDPAAVTAVRVSANMFDVLNAPPLRGRTFAADEDTPARKHVVLLSAALWKRMFGSDTTIVGRTVLLNDEPHEVIGVMPAGFGLGYREELWIPLDLSARLADVNRARKTHSYYAIARLRPDVSLEAARADLQGVAHTIEQRHPEENKDHGITVLPLQTALAGDARRASFILAGAAALVLLIACANLGNMMLARAVTRRREMVIRATIGASRGHLVRQLLTESVLLALIGGVMGVGLAAVVTPMLVRAAASALPPMADVHIDWRVLAASFAVSIVMGILVGGAPALSASRIDLNSALKESSRSSAGDSRGDRVRKSLVVTQVAMAVALLLVAGLLVRSFDAVRRNDLGFRPERALAASVAVRGTRYQTTADFNRFYDGLFATLRRSPGIVAVGASSALPLLGSSSCSLAIDGRVFPSTEVPEARCLAALGDYFQAMGTRLIAGRMWDATDLADGPQVTIVNASLAHQYWPNESPVGKRIRLGPDPSQPWMTIIGVVADQRQSDLETEPRPTAFEYAVQHDWGSLDIAVRTSGDPMLAAPILRAAVHDADPTLAVRNVRTFEEIVGASLAARRFLLSLIASFAGLALVLAIVGIYGVLAYMVEARTREIGVRMALGATASLIRNGVVRQGLGWTGIGIAAGAVCGLALARAVRSILYGVPPWDVVTFVAVAVVFAVVATIACLVPAHRATSVDPLVAMRQE